MDTAAGFIRPHPRLGGTLPNGSPGFPPPTSPPSSLVRFPRAGCILHESGRQATCRGDRRARPHLERMGGDTQTPPSPHSPQLCSPPRLFRPRDKDGPETLMLLCASISPQSGHHGTALPLPRLIRSIHFSNRRLTLPCSSCSCYLSSSLGASFPLILGCSWLKPIEQARRWVLVLPFQHKKSFAY